MDRGAWRAKSVGLKESDTPERLTLLLSPLEYHIVGWLFAE